LNSSNIGPSIFPSNPVGSD